MMNDDEKGRPEPVLRLPVRYYQIARLYGPGMPPSGVEGYHERVLEKPVSQAALVSVHCWNLGEADGPYPIGADAHCPGEAADWVPTAHEIIRDRIKPAMDAARRAGISVFHLAQHTYAPRYATYRAITEDEELKSPTEAPAFEGCIRPRPVDEQWADEYGKDFPGPVWVTHRDTFDIARAVRPQGSESVIVDDCQLNGLCRRRGIDTLVYVGFMADLCLVNVPGAIRDMAGKFGYRCIVLRDCTTAYEFPDTHEGGYMTLAAIRLIETSMGYSAGADDFIAACRAAR